MLSRVSKQFYFKVKDLNGQPYLAVSSEGHHFYDIPLLDSDSKGGSRKLSRQYDEFCKQHILSLGPGNISRPAILGFGGGQSPWHTYLIKHFQPKLNETFEQLSPNSRAAKCSRSESTVIINAVRAELRCTLEHVNPLIVCT